MIPPTKAPMTPTQASTTNQYARLVNQRGRTGRDRISAVVGCPAGMLCVMSMPRRVFLSSRSGWNPVAVGR